MFRKLWIAAVSVILLSACQKRFYTPVELRNDTIIIERLTEIVQPSDSASVKARIACDERGRIAIQELAISEGKRLKLQASLDSLGRLSIDSRLASDTLYLPSRDTRIETVREIPVEVPGPERMSPWSWYFVIATIVLSIPYIVRIAIRIRKFF